MHATRRVLTIFAHAVKTFMRIDGAERAGAIAYYAFFSLFPLIILFVTIVTVFIDRNQATVQVFTFIQTFIHIGEAQQSYIFDTIAGVVNERAKAGVLAFILLGWVAMDFFAALIRVTNRAWGIEAHEWWRLPIKTLIFLAVIVTAVPLGITVTLLAKAARDWLFPSYDFSSWVYSLGGFTAPLMVVFVGLSLVYKLAPRRRRRFAEVWAAAICATFLLLATETIFEIYLKHFATLNMVYGAFGSIMALLLWIYLSGCIFIFGACLCAAQADERSRTTGVES